MVKVRCPGCQATVEVDPKDGPGVECEECGKKFRLAVKKPAAVNGVKKSAPPPPDDDDEEDDEPVQKKPKKKKSRKKSASIPGWLLPVFGGVTVVVGIILVVVLVVIPTLKRGALLDLLTAVPDDADSIAVVRPKGVTGASGNRQLEVGMGGGSHYAPTPPDGYGMEPGHVTEAIRVKKGLKVFYVISADWKPRPSMGAVTTHREVPIREDKPKHLDKPRYVVASSSALALFESVDDAKAAIDKMLDNKKPPYVPHPKFASYYSRSPGKMQEIFTEGRGPDIAKPKSVMVELSDTDDDVSVTYTLDYGTPEAAAAAKSSIEACYKVVDEEIAKWWKDNPYHEGASPYVQYDKLKYTPKEIDGGKLTMKVKVSHISKGAAMALIHECFNMGDAPFKGFEKMPGLGM